MLRRAAERYRCLIIETAAPIRSARNGYSGQRDKGSDCVPPETGRTFARPCTI
jgi:hypothetical protein